MKVPRYLIRDRDQIYGSIVTRRLRAMGIRDKPTAPASPWQNGIAERLIGTLLRECLDQMVIFDELLNGEIFYSPKGAQVVIGQWRKHYNTVRPHSLLGYRPPAPQTMNPFLTPLDQAVLMQ